MEVKEMKITCRRVNMWQFLGQGTPAQIFTFRIDINIYSKEFGIYIGVLKYLVWFRLKRR